jgi:S1-C subfamily serine protease
MSDRPEDHTDPEEAGPKEAGPEATGAGASGHDGPWERTDAPWWQQPHAGPGPWAGYGTPAQAGRWQGSEESSPAAPGPSAPGPYGYPGYAGGPGGAAGPGGGAPGGPGGWPGGQWSGGPWGWGPQGGGWGHLHHQPPRPSRRKGLAAVAGACLALLALLIGVGIGYGVWNGGSAPTSGRSLLPSGGTSRSTTTTSSGSSGTASTGKVSSSTGAPSNTATIAAKVTPGLVDINTVLSYQTEEAAGTGMVLTSTGRVLTNNHVIEGATKISVTDLGNGKVYSATVLGYTRTQDIAVLQLKNASGLKTVRIGNSASVKVGEAIVGVGNAGGVGGKPSAAGGSVTNLNQAITASDQGSLGTTTEHLTGLIESNANIQPGDSGGPLVTTSGAVVGMDTAASASQGYSFQGAATGQGYSIPINAAISTARQIIAGRTSASVHIGGTAFLGVFIEAATSTQTQLHGFGFGTSTTTTGTPTTRGAVVYNVIPNTPAEGSGLTRGDVITSVNGSTVANPSSLTKIMLQYHPGDSVRVDWTTSSGQSESAMIALGSGPPD